MEKIRTEVKKILFGLLAILMVFRVQSAPLIGGEWRTEGTGTASRPIGVAFSNSFTFR